jgi:sulfide dehydrogenase cytochrome subunit
MKSRACRIALAALIVLGGSAQGAWAQSVDISNVLPLCEGCHGSGGQSVLPTTPIIAGIDAGIIADAIYAFQDGDYPCPNSPMCATVGGISAEKAEALGKYFSEKPFVPAKQSFDAAKAARGAVIHAADCEQCHSRGGSDPEDQASILAGQWMPYLREVLTDYANGKRDALEPMRRRLEMMTPEDIDALANFYASEGSARVANALVTRARPNP